MELARACFAVPLAVLLPYSAPSLRSMHLGRLVLSVAVGLLFLAPTLDEPAGWALLVVIALSQAVLGPLTRRAGAAPGHAPPDVPVTARAVALAAAGIVLALLLLAGDPFRRLWDEVTDDSSVWLLVVEALLLATLAYGVVVEAAIGWVGRGIQELRAAANAEGVPQAGRIIGWLERTAIFGAILLGRPEAVALVLGLKTVARFPQFRNEAFGEYFQIGTFISTLGAAAIAVLTRVVLGDSPL